MAGRCAGCTNKYGFFEHPRLCPECRRQFCQSCLPHLPPDSKKKKKTEPLISVNPCVYCIKQKGINQVEEAKILENFEERFYKHSHTEPPIQTKIHQDITKGVPPNEGNVSYRLSEKDRALEERLKKLKESSNPQPSRSEDEIRDRVAELRGENSPGSSHSPPVTRGNTQVEQARDLIDKTTDEIKIDEKLDETRSKKDEELARRLQALKGIKDTDTHTQKSKKHTIDIDAFEDLELEIPEEDPEKLLNSLRALQSREEQSALAEVGQDDIQALIKRAKELAKEDQGMQGDGENMLTRLSSITYPDLDEMEGGDKKKEEAEVARLVSDVMNEIEQEKDDIQFAEETASKLSQLRQENPSGEEIDEGDVVRSKLDYPQNLNVSWDHFGQQTGASKDDIPLAAQQLGIPVSVDGEDPEIKRLVEKATAEAELDRKLEAGGLSLRPPQEKDQSGAARAWPEAAGGDEEFPWCCICNADATIRCYDCDDDLYCTRCFSDGHQQFGLFDHRYAAFEPPKQ